MKALSRTELSDYKCYVNQALSEFSYPLRPLVGSTERVKDGDVMALCFYEAAVKMLAKKGAIKEGWFDNDPPIQFVTKEDSKTIWEE